MPTPDSCTDEMSTTDQTAIVLAKAVDVLADLERRLERIEQEIGATSSSAPGLAIRVRDIERQIAAAGRLLSWIGGGGLVGLAGTLVFLWKILRSLAEGGA